MRAIYRLGVQESQTAAVRTALTVAGVGLPSPSPSRSAASCSATGRIDRSIEMLGFQS